MKITKGIIAAAGKGTRFLPATRAVPKELLPIVDKPIIQYIVEEFISAGITDIAIVSGENSSLIASHFRPNPQLEKHLEKSGKIALLKEMRRIPKMGKITFIKQHGPYGNGTPCLNARKFAGNLPFVYAFGDDLVLSARSFTKQMCEAYRKKPGLYLGAQTVPARDVPKYGIMRVKRDTAEVIGVVEKPTQDSAPSNLASIGRFILPPEIFPILAKKRLGAGRELWLADAIHALIRQGQKTFYKTIEQGRWYTTGDPINYLAATRAFALSRPDLKNRLKHIFR